MANGGVLAIQVDNAPSSHSVFIHYQPKDDTFQVDVAQVPLNGSQGPPLDITHWPAAAVKLIRFEGGPHADLFDPDFSVTRPCLVRGNDGDDVLFGSVGNDTIEGGANDDLLEGFGGDDRIFGGDGTDVLTGDNGADALFGGADGFTDSLIGGAGPDRFLKYLNPRIADVIADQAGDDVVLTLLSQDRTWNDLEVAAVDDGLRMLYQVRQNNSLLRPPDSPDRSSTIGLWRARKAPPPKPGQPVKPVAARHTNNTTLTFYDLAFSAGPAVTAINTVHEFAHNYDSVALSSTWRGYSGWTTVTPPGGDKGPYANVNTDKSPETPHESPTFEKPQGWWYLRKAAFARSYGRVSPYEDWTTTWEYYFARRFRLSLGNFPFEKPSPDKLSLVARFLAAKS
jgi:hypothetical protein